MEIAIRVEIFRRRLHNLDLFNALMFSNPDVNHVTNPITALAFVNLGSQLLLLAGEGPYLKIFHHDTSQVLEVKRVFESQAVHGIATTNAATYIDGVIVVNLLIWGNKSLRIAQLHANAADARPCLDLKDELQADDWILDACFRPGVYSAPQDRDAVLVTAHNVAFHLCSAPRSRRPTLKHVKAGPRSMLYSACIEWTEDRKIVIASGTVLGEVLLWSFSHTELSAVRGGTPVSHELHYRFEGHEGSVFGVGISPELSGLGSGYAKRMLASCSDDRTIRLWDISGLDKDEVLSDGKLEHIDSSIVFPDDDTKHVTVRCVATVMGHASRIWDLRFLVSGNGLGIISLGEDSTAQMWQLAHDPRVEGSSPTRGPDNLHLVHRQTYAFNQGKNIWASALVRNDGGSHTVVTGGADGRIVSHNIHQGDDIAGGKRLTTEWTMQDVNAKLQWRRPLIAQSAPAVSPSPRNTKSQYVFEELGGTWVIKRNIRSARPTYPSGIFNGKATLERRYTSATDIDREYLYTEDGTFTADQGLAFQASRQYVYRYRHDSDTISAWFVKPDEHSRADYLFHDLRLEDSSESKNGQHPPGELLLQASGYHLCIDDHYTPTYTFRFKDAALEEWSLAYQVSGPQKDYVAEASYTREHDDQRRNRQCDEHETTSAQMQLRRCKESLPGDQKTRKDDFKSYVFLQYNLFLVTTAQGRVLLGSIVAPFGIQGKMLGFGKGSPAVKWELIGQFDALRSSSIATKALESYLVLVSGNNGIVFSYGILEKQILPIFDLGRKATFLYAQRIHNRDGAQLSGVQEHLILATCLGLPVAHVHKHGDPDLDDPKQLYFLSLPDSFIVTSACYIEPFSVWMLGSRSGSVAFYDASLLSADTKVEPCSIVLDVHGENAITVMQCLWEWEVDQPVYILTAGRDGKYALHTISTTRSASKQLEVIFHTVHRSMPPLGPNIEGAAFDSHKQELTLWGFRSKFFIVWNASKDMETTTVECGGAHRHWAHIPRGNGAEGGTFVWTKASVCNVHLQTSTSHKVFQSGGHGREIKAMALSPVLDRSDGSKNRYIATGAEDTTIRIWSYNHERGSEDGFKRLATLNKHTTGIQQLQWSDNGQLLFSAAGCEEFFAWRVQPVSLIGIGAVCEALCPSVTEDGDLRIMDFCFEEIDSQNNNLRGEGRNYLVSIVYSDSSLRIFRYISNCTRSYFTLLQTNTYTTNCLTQVLRLQPTTQATTHSYLCTASSDGHIALWPADSIFCNPTPDPDLKYNNKNNTIHFSHRHRIHQNTIKCMTVVQPASAPNQYLLLSGGDDGALGITRLTFYTPSTAAGEPPTCSTLLYPKAHAAAINAISYIRTLRGPAGSPPVQIFATSGNDQRVKTWGVQCAANVPGTEGLRVEKRGDKSTSVGDVAALCAMTTSHSGTHVFVAGIGMECLRDVELGMAVADGL